MVNVLAERLYEKVIDKFKLENAVPDGSPAYARITVFIIHDIEFIRRFMDVLKQDIRCQAVIEVVPLNIRFNKKIGCKHTGNPARQYIGVKRAIWQFHMVVGVV